MAHGLLHRGSRNHMRLAMEELLELGAVDARIPGAQHEHRRAVDVERHRLRDLRGRRPQRRRGLLDRRRLLLGHDYAVAIALRPQMRHRLIERHNKKLLRQTNCLTEEYSPWTCRIREAFACEPFVYKPIRTPTLWTKNATIQATATWNANTATA